nr:37s ribosomal protein s23, mitochondrial [Quercus suber]
MARPSSSSLCLRCFSLSMRPVEVRHAAQRSGFSTTSFLAKAPPPKKQTGPVKNVKARSGTTLVIKKKKKPLATARPPAVGERKALRKRIVLSNTNALEVPGMQNFTPEIIRGIGEHEGRMVGLSDAAVDMLRAVEAFKPTQGWNLFRRPATLIRKETTDLAQAMLTAQAEKSHVGKVVIGERGCGKSVLVLQGLAMAHTRGWVVVHLPDARDLANATTSYEPLETSDGTIWIQPHYTAHLLSNILSANKNVLSQYQITKQHELPVPVQSNMTLSRFVEMGANDPQLAYPVWQALWSELTSPSSSEAEVQRRPPVFVGADGVEYIMGATAYLDSEMQPIHAHDLALVRDFNNLLTGKTSLPNGGVIMGAASGTNRPSVPTFEHCSEKNVVLYFSTWAKSLSERVSKKSTISSDEIKLSEMSNLHVSHPSYGALSSFLYDFNLLTAEARNDMPEEATGSAVEFSGPLKVRLDEIVTTLASDAARLVPTWDPYLEIDERVQSVMAKAHTQQLFGLSKSEARGVIEYYAQSGMLRNTVTDGLVNEKWTLAGKGLIGELERGTVKLRF